MKNLAIVFLLASSVAQAGVLFTFTAPGGALQGAPGQTVYWNVQLSNDANYLLIDQVDYLSLNNAGTFTDLFSVIAPVIGPGDVIDGSSAYTIDLPAPLGCVSNGQFVVTYDEFLSNPNDPDFDFDRDHVNGDPEKVSALASVQVAMTPVAATPEPSAFGLLLLGLGVAWSVRSMSRFRKTQS